jgi:hypothetical protein
MKLNPLKLAALVLLPSALLTLSSCTNLGGNEQTTLISAPNGAAVVDTYTNRATVTAINRANRQLSLKMENGSRTTAKCGKDVVNFNQIKVNDVVKVTLIDELAIYLGKGTSPEATTTGGVALSPIGAKPGVVMAETVKISAKITAVNAKSRTVSLKLPDGTTKTVKVGKDVNLGNVKAGESVTVRHTEAMAILVEKP